MRSWDAFTLVVVIFLLSLLNPAEALECPFKPKASKPLAPKQDPKCTKDTEAVRERQALMDTYCEHYQFKKNGTGAPGQCITVQDQFVPPSVEKCAGKFGGLDCMGPLGQLIGTWEGDLGKSFTWIPGYDPMSAREAESLPAGLGRVPQQPMADGDDIKTHSYKELLVFRPIFGDVKNRGLNDASPINAECRDDQSFHGLTYNLEIRQTSSSTSNGEFDGVLHEENGMLLYNTIPASGGGTGYTIVNLLSVPHGITVTAIGNDSTVTDGPNAGCELLSQQQALPMSVVPTPGNCLMDNTYDRSDADWGFFQNGTYQGGRDNTSMTDFLTNRTEEFSSIKDFFHIHLEDHDIAQTPFLEQQAKNKNYVYDLWLSTVANEDGTEDKVLQYSQSVQFEFMQRPDCLDCVGVTSKDNNGCIASCEGFESYILNATLNGNSVESVLSPNERSEFIPGRNFNEIDGFVHQQCYDCKPSFSPDLGKGADGTLPSCAEQPLMLWPHMQVNTLRKISDNYQTPADFKGPDELKKVLNEEEGDAPSPSTPSSTSPSAVSPSPSPSSASYTFVSSVFLTVMAMVLTYLV